MKYQKQCSKVFQGKGLWTGEKKLKCNKKLVKQQFAEITGKQIILKDVHNMKVNKNENLQDIVNYLESLDGGYVEVLAAEEKLEGIFFQDEKMRAFSSNPNIFLLDATYCLTICLCRCMY